MSYGEEQRKEIETIREKTIRVKLSEADCERLSLLCGRHGLTVGSLIENFIGDLVCGTYSNGSDERMYAEQWFDRCWFGMFPEETLLNYLLDEGYDIKDFLALPGDIEGLKEDLAYFEEKQIEEDIKSCQEELSDMEAEYHGILDDFTNRHPEADLQKEIEAVKNWFEASQSLKEE